MSGLRNGIIIGGGIASVGIVLWLIFRIKKGSEPTEEKIIGKQSGDIYYKRDGVWYHDNGNKVNQEMFYKHQYPN